MKRESHKILGNYLMEQLQELPAYRYQKAFLLGCIEPDSNPLTYLKGSRSIQWLRGHNYRNAERWIGSTCGKLEARETWRLLDYYRLGKLIHYTSDAFTFAHNETFLEDIRAHRSYEAKLQRYFKTTLALQYNAESQQCYDSVMAAIEAAHDRYMEAATSIATDVTYILEMAGQVFASLIPQPEPTVALA
ncbi:MAG: zinc dependent phospholipase C family protein [Oscillospiraceae bacterium]